jgi:hypothetical protein
MTLGKIFDNSCTLKGDILFNHFVSLFEPNSNRETLRKLYRSYFIEAAVDSMIIGTSDEHGNNIILDINGFYHLDQGRSLSNSNNFLVWGDSPRLPYHSALLKEEEFFLSLSIHEIEELHEHLLAIQKEEKNIEAFFDHPMQKEQGGLDHLPPGWLYKKSTCKAIHQRLKRMIAWTSNELRLAKKNKNTGALEDLLRFIYPYHTLVTCLYTVIKIFPSYVLNQLHKDHLDDDVFINFWKIATANAGKFQDRRNSFDGKIHDVMTLLDLYADLGLDCRELLNLTYEEKKTKILQGKPFLKDILDQMMKKIARCQKRGFFGENVLNGSAKEEKLFQTLSLFNHLRHMINICQKNGFEKETNQFAEEYPESWQSIKFDVESIFKQLAKAGFASEALADHSHEDPNSIYLSAIWILENNTLEYLKTAFKALDLVEKVPLLNLKEDLKEIKLILCEKALIDYKDISKPDLTSWFIQYLYKLCQIAEIPYMTKENIPTFELGKNSDFLTEAFKILSQFYSKGYCLKFYPVSSKKEEPQFLEAGCSLSYLDAEGKIVKCREIFSAIVIEGKIQFKIKVNTNYHLIPLMEFFDKIEELFKKDIEMNNLCVENRQYANHLFPLNYFISVLMSHKIEFFDSDAYEFDQEVFKEIHNFLLFFKRVYIHKKNEKFFLCYLDNDGLEHNCGLDFDKVTLTIRKKDNISCGLEEFCQSIAEQYANKNFHHGNVKFALSNDETFEIKAAEDTIEGIYDLYDRSVLLKEKSGARQLNLHEFKEYLDKF